MKKLPRYFFNVFLALDYLGNAIAGGDPEETISHRLGREYPNSFMRKLVDLIFGKGHCQRVSETGTNGQAIHRRK